MRASLRWLFPEVVFGELRLQRDEGFILARVLERGRLVDVRWAIDAYGLPEIHRFLRDEGHAELGERTLTFWRAVLRAGKEKWKSPPPWRRSRIASWPV